MPVTRPYRRTCRQFVDGQYTEGGRWQYMIHPKFAQSPEHFVRAFLLIQKDLLELFDYVEPADKNLHCYSYRIYALLLRACVEVEANFKAILKENGYNRPGDWTMADYRKIEKTHYLSEYTVKVPNWTGSSEIRRPFTAWGIGGSLAWYQVYNTTKHDRHSEFEKANFEHLIDACAGLIVLLSSQFETNDFSPRNSHLVVVGGTNDGMESGIGEYFRIGFPKNWPHELRYDFNWEALRNDVDPFQCIDYTQIS